MSTLIVLDINGVICNKGEEGIRINAYYCIKPIQGYMEFINTLLDLGYKIAWFSSTSYKNASKILRSLDLYDKPSVFKWYGAGDTKNLKDVKKKHKGYKHYIIIDDSPEKITCNKENEKIIFEGNYNDVLLHINDITENENRTIRYCKE